MVVVRPCYQRQLATANTIGQPPTRAPSACPGAVISRNTHQGMVPPRLAWLHILHLGAHASSFTSVSALDCDQMRLTWPLRQFSRRRSNSMR